MPLFRKILVPIDHSSFADAAVRYVVEMARGMAAQVVLLYVEPIHLTTDHLDPVSGHIEINPRRMEAARHRLAELEGLLDGVVSQAVLRSGDPGSEILACADEEGVDLIVMATHGRGGLSRLVMGSTTEAVVRSANVPVMTLRAAWLSSSVEGSSVHPALG